MKFSSLFCKADAHFPAPGIWKKETDSAYLYSGIRNKMVPARAASPEGTTTSGALEPITSEPLPTNTRINTCLLLRQNEPQTLLSPQNNAHEFLSFSFPAKSNVTILSLFGVESRSQIYHRVQVECQSIMFCQLQ